MRRRTRTTNAEHALELFAKEEIRDTLQPSWGYDEACAHLGIMRQEGGDIEGAREAFQDLRNTSTSCDLPEMRYTRCCGKFR